MRRDNLNKFGGDEENVEFSTFSKSTGVRSGITSSRTNPLSQKTVASILRKKQRHQKTTNNSTNKLTSEKSVKRRNDAR